MSNETELKMPWVYAEQMTGSDAEKYVGPAWHIFHSHKGFICNCTCTEDKNYILRMLRIAIKKEHTT